MKFKINDQVMIKCKGWKEACKGVVLNVIPGHQPDGPFVEPYCVKREGYETPGWFAEHELTLDTKAKQKVTP